MRHANKCETWSSWRMIYLIKCFESMDEREFVTGKRYFSKRSSDRIYNHQMHDWKKLKQAEPDRNADRTQSVDLILYRHSFAVHREYFDVIPLVHSLSWMTWTLVWLVSISSNESRQLGVVLLGQRHKRNKIFVNPIHKLTFKWFAETKVKSVCEMG